MKKLSPQFMILFGLVISLILPHTIQAQRKNRNKNVPQDTYHPYSPKLYQSLKWRNIGPFRGGRVTTVAGVPSQPNTYYFGGTGGGVWKTIDGGAVWRNISDGFFKTGSVGAIGVANTDYNVIYVGMGEAPVRGVMTSHGDGVYKSTDGGTTWEHKGLEKVRQISRIHIHPNNSDIVYVAAQGSPHAPNPERGIYRSLDGGDTWELVLHVDERSGASDLSMNMSNPRVLYAAFWEHQRFPWKVVSGGPGSSIWKSTDGGTTWEKLEKGLPDVVMGKIGISVSPANSNRVWAIIESEKGGLYRSDDAGKSWKLINSDRILRARSWYYMHVFADTQDENIVYVLNAPFMKSIDGGKTFQQMSTPHGDNHALWIHPTNNQILINGNDGGANISYNGGQTWSTQSNQPTAQFYRVNADNRFPYYVYGGQQDNSSVAIPNQTDGRGIQNSDFYSVGGCESAYCAFDPDDPMHVYAGCYQGIITEYDVENDLEKDVMAYPYLGLGTKPAEVKYRFNWNAPIIVSQHDTKVIYHAGNKLLKSSDRGLNWEEVSPDLTRNVTEHLDYGGGPITREGAGGEVYHTIMYIAESPTDANTIWAGADDGLMHITRDGGKNWTEITPPNVAEGMVNCIDLSPFDEGTAYVAYTRYKFNDFTPHIFVTKDFGATWTRKVSGIAPEAHVRVVRADPGRKGLLYVGTETGLYISFDNGDHWEIFQLNLPIVPITDLKVHQNDLIAATQGRAFWVLDDLTPLHQLDEKIANSDFYFYPPQDAFLFGGPRIDSLPEMGTNPDNGAVLFYYLKEVPEEDSLALTIEILNKAEQIIRTYASTEKSKPKTAPKKSGMNKLVWDLRTPAYEGIKGVMVLGSTNGYRVNPGQYKARISYGNDTTVHNLEVKGDPRLQITTAEYEVKQDLLAEIGKAVGDLYTAVKEMRHIKEQIKSLMDRYDDDDRSAKKLLMAGKAIISDIDSLENTMIQPKQKTFQDVINFPNQLDAKLLHIQSSIDGSVPPLTTGQKQRAADMLTEWKEKKEIIDKILGERLDEYNEMIKKAEVPFVGRKKKE